MSKKKRTSFISLLENYLTVYLPYSKGVSPNTIRSYKHSFLLLMDYMYAEKGLPADQITFASLDQDTLLDFFNWLERSRNCKAVTRNQRLSALNSFSAYAQNRDIEAATVFRSAINRIPVKKASMKPRAVFTRDEVKLLLALPDERKETGLRDKVILSVMYASGARAQEICDLRVRDVSFRDDTATLVITGKGNKTRRVGIPAACATLLKKYLKHRHIEQNGGRHVFSSQTHEKMTVSCVEGIFKKYVTTAKSQHEDLFPADSYPPHSMRHSTASHLLEAGVDIVTIKNLLGHASVMTTQIYAELSQETVDKKLQEWNERWFSRDKLQEKTNNCETDPRHIPAFIKA